MTNPPHVPPDPDDDLGAYVGLRQSDAERRAREHGWDPVRSLPPGSVITMEYVQGRLNFEVADGEVTRSWRG